MESNKNIDCELKKHRFIVFGIDHYNPLGLVRSLGESGIRPDVIIASSKPILLSHCKYVNHLQCVSNREEGLDYLLKHYSKENPKPFILTGDDKTTELLDSHYNDIIKDFYFFNAGSKGQLFSLMNKDVITSMAEEVGFAIPKKEIVNHGELPKSLKYPIITKTIMSILGGWKSDVYICNTEEELRNAYPHIQTPKLMIQEYVDKKSEWCFEGFSANKGRDIYIPFVIKYIRFSKKSYGFYMTVEPLEDNELREKLYELMRRTQFEGIFEMEFMEGMDGELYFLEVNFRNSPWSYALTCGNVNVPYLWAKSILSESIDYDSIHPQKTMFKAINEVADFIENVKTGKIPFLKWYRQMRECQCKYYYSKADPKPFYALMRKMLFDKLFGNKRK